jgi:lipopolysaccharide transport system ATP-binding protein
VTDLAVRAEGLSKLYLLVDPADRHDKLRDWLGDRVRALAHGPRRERRSPDAIWALKDVSFEIRAGEAVGVVGRNGSGKSTLLRILSRITEPTEGRAEIYGRIVSLLDVGTGFHPDLTGRDNVYLSAAILGMKKAEITRKFDEMVAFAEIGRFIDTPVKRYSSGMYIRLAFAVAAHLEPEILIVDEVLAVGDAAFQSKCLEKMGDVARSGRAVILVSHNMSAVTALATRAIFLEAGRLSRQGPVHDVVQAYLASAGSSIPRGRRTLEPPPHLPFTVTGVSVSDGLGEAPAVLPRSRPIVVTIRGEVHALSGDRDEYVVGLDVMTSEDWLLFRTYNIEQRETASVPDTRGPFVLRCVLPADLLVAGTYRLGVVTAIAGRRELQETYPVLEFDVVQDARVAGVFVESQGILTPRCRWTGARRRVRVLED